LNADFLMTDPMLQMNQVWQNPLVRSDVNAGRVPVLPEISANRRPNWGSFTPADLLEIERLRSIKIVDVQVLRPEYRVWLRDSVWTKVAAVLVVLLWTVFYVARWIARGFVG
jgi:hypothetical protein